MLPPLLSPVVSGKPNSEPFCPWHRRRWVWGFLFFIVLKIKGTQVHKMKSKCNYFQGVEGIVLGQGQHWSGNGRAGARRQGNLCAPWFFDKATFCSPNLLKWCTFVSCKSLLFEFSLSAVSGVSRITTGRASIHARKRLRLCWISLWGRPLH